MSYPNETAKLSHLEDEKYDVQKPNYLEPLSSTHSIDTLDQKQFYEYSNTSIQELNPQDEYQKMKNENRRQQFNILISCMSKYLITLALCSGYVLVTSIWLGKSALSAFEKRVYNTIVTGISIALGLNISSAFRDIVQTLRWPIMSLRKRNIEELDMLLQIESLITVTKLIFSNNRPFLRIGCIVWLIINIAIQAGLAMVSLTYNFDTDQERVQLIPGQVAIPSLDHFYPQTNRAVSNQSLPDEQYTAHTYGEFALNYGIGLVSSEPSPGQIYLSTDPLLWLDKSKNMIKFIFLDSPEGAQVVESFSAFTERQINVTFGCSSFGVLQGGDGKTTEINIDRVGRISLPQAVPDSTTYITRSNHTCKANNRCSVVEAFEASSTDPWYYVCEISMGMTQNDSKNISFVSDYLAQIATASIAQIGYTDSKGIASQIYPRESLWGQMAKGDPSDVGMMMAIYAIASLAGAAQFNPFTSYSGNAPGPGFILKLNHRTTFYFILFNVNLCHLSFVLVAIAFSSMIKVRDSGFISMGICLKPVTDALLSIGKTRNEKGYESAKLRTYAIYEKDIQSNDWKFKVSF
ncbi:hypothetical protein HI914_02507 [Erysiphe necator]|uniref:Uncharacterized protein n=1 Tax=Uncinula necator TaxID=52586 RepID=A0A0B1P0N1_UNCNE|nr:hypothetical protein HI914_02507 [Erysiphe necator]KHJ30369.1 hypothetical protein EV44_g2011 [Erysiphe necator]